MTFKTPKRTDAYKDLDPVLQAQVRRTLKHASILAGIIIGGVAILLASRRYVVRKEVCRDVVCVCVCMCIITSDFIVKIWQLMRR